MTTETKQRACAAARPWIGMVVAPVWPSQGRACKGSWWYRFQWYQQFWYRLLQCI